nr:rRNA-processing protein EFG1-like [Tanacetum cinerariifolium]
MNQNFYNYNFLGSDQIQPPRFPIVHPPPQETCIEISHDKDNVINSVQTFLRKFNRYSFFETPKVLLLAWDRVFEIKDAFDNRQYKPEVIQEWFRKLLDNLQNIHKELAEFINSLSWNRPAVYDDDDDDVEKIVIPEDEEIKDDNLREKLLKYEVFSFYDDHIKEISSSSTTTQSDISLPEYDSFIFDLSNGQFPPTDRSDFTNEEFGDEPAHIISPPEYNCFYFRNLLDLGELISSLNSGIREHLSSTTCVNLPVKDDYSPLLAYVFFPKIEKYASLFKKRDATETADKRNSLHIEIKENIAAAVASGKDFEETGSDDDGLDLSEDDFFLSES